MIHGNPWLGTSHRRMAASHRQHLLGLVMVR
jgi:hypothetical protein